MENIGYILNWILSLVFLLGSLALIYICLFDFGGWLIGLHCKTGDIIIRETSFDEKYLVLKGGAENITVLSFTNDKLNIDNVYFKHYHIYKKGNYIDSLFPYHYILNKIKSGKYKGLKEIIK